MIRSTRIWKLGKTIYFRACLTEWNKSVVWSFLKYIQLQKSYSTKIGLKLRGQSFTFLQKCYAKSFIDQEHCILLVTDNLGRRKMKRNFDAQKLARFAANSTTIHRFNEWIWRLFVHTQCTLCIFEFLHYLVRFKLSVIDDKNKS